MTDPAPAPPPPPLPRQNPGFLRELVAFLRERKAYWIAPIIIILLLLIVLVILGGTSLAPFIYTLF